MITAIFSTKATTLTIATSEALSLEQMEGEPVRLSPGTNSVSVGAGVFRVLSRNVVRVTADASDIHVVSTDSNKDGGFPGGLPDNMKGWKDIDPQTIRAFFSDAKSSGSL